MSNLAVDSHRSEMFKLGYTCQAGKNAREKFVFGFEKRVLVKLETSIDLRVIVICTLIIRVTTNLDCGLILDRTNFLVRAELHFIWKTKPHKND